MNAKSENEPACIGWNEHRWTLEIEEGSVHVSTTSCGPDCPAALWGLGDYAELLTMGEAPVTVHMATECPAYDVDNDNVPTGGPRQMRGYESGSHYIAHGSRCDCNWWPVLRLVGASERTGVAQ